MSKGRRMADLPQVLADQAHFLKQATYTSSAVTVGSGAWTWLDDHSRAIGAVCAIVGLIATIVFGYLNYRTNQKR